MRITCEKCAAPYSIEDRLVTSKGVRAQCPRCRHVQLVRREESEPAGKPRPRSSVEQELFGDIPSPEGPLQGAEASEAPTLPMESLPGHSHCEKCGRQLKDPLEQAIGICEGCR